MRLVAVADTHTFHDDLRVPDGDLFIHAGDLCRGGTLEELEHTVGWIRGLPHQHKLVIAGNHDWIFVHDPAAARAMLGDIAYLQDSEASVGGLRIWGSPWQPEYNDWAFNLPRGQALRDKWALIPSDLDVLITHGPPAGIGDDGGMAVRAGCADLRTRVEAASPRLHLFGHIHQDGGLWTVGATTYANVTTWECERQPTVIDIEPGRVTAIEVPPRERR